MRLDCRFVWIITENLSVGLLVYWSMVTTQRFNLGDHGKCINARQNWSTYNIGYNVAEQTELRGKHPTYKKDGCTKQWCRTTINVRRKHLNTLNLVAGREKRLTQWMLSQPWIRNSCTRSPSHRWWQSWVGQRSPGWRCELQLRSS